MHFALADSHRNRITHQAESRCQPQAQQQNDHDSKDGLDRRGHGNVRVDEPENQTDDDDGYDNGYDGHDYYIARWWPNAYLTRYGPGAAAPSGNDSLCPNLPEKTTE